ncbi:Rpn family recombination-promoting nuclease/putative transposase [Enterococcus gilvus]|uniref:Rpn family recombination-promoting nuclease/putative transposase n=1 Tax=Enterococcus gilvus TaxID=160453 RepID=UPI003D6C0B94
MLEYLPTNDLIFKKMLTSEDSANILRNFVKDLLDIEFKTLTPKETYHIDSYKKSYEHLEIGLTEVDILAVAEDGSQATIECQIQPHQFFQERTVFYLREAFRAPFGNRESEDFVVKNNFSALRPAYGINIIDFHLFDKDQDALQTYRLLNKTTQRPFVGGKGKELLTLCFLSLKNKNIEKDSKAYHWQYFLKTGEALQEAPAYIKEAQKKINYFKLNEEEKTMITRINKAKDINDAVISSAKVEGFDYGHEEGLRKGRKEGQAEGRKEGHRKGHKEGHKEGKAEGERKIALNLLEMGLPIEKISEATGLEVEILQQLKSEEK